MDNMNSNLRYSPLNLSFNFAKSICIFFFLSTAYLAASYYSYGYRYELSFFFSFSFLLIICALAYKGQEPQKREIFYIFLIAFLPKLLWILVIYPNQTSDFAVIYSASEKAAQGDYSFTNMPYFKTYSYQIGIVAYQTLILKITGIGQFWLKLINCLYIAATSYFIYKIAVLFLNKKAAAVSMLAYALYLPTIYSSALLTNQHLATFLFTASTYFLLISEVKGLKAVIISSVLAACGHVIRPIGELFALAAISYFVFLALSEGKGAFKNRTYAAILFLGIFMITSIVIGKTINLSGLYDGKLSNNNVYWKFVTGLNYDTKGYYSKEDADILAAAEKNGNSKEVQLSIIKDRISDPQYLIKLFTSKYKEMWGRADNILNFSLRGTDLEKSPLSLAAFMHGQYFGIMLLGGLGLISIRHNRNLLFIFIIISLYVSIHLVIEIQSRYRYFLMPFVFIFVGNGIDLLSRLCSNAMERVRTMRVKAPGTD